MTRRYSHKVRSTLVGLANSVCTTSYIGLLHAARVHQSEDNENFRLHQTRNNTRTGCERIDSQIFLCEAPYIRYNPIVVLWLPSLFLAYHVEDVHACGDVAWVKREFLLCILSATRDIPLPLSVCLCYAIIYGWKDTHIPSFYCWSFGLNLYCVLNMPLRAAAFCDGYACVSILAMIVYIAYPYTPGNQASPIDATDAWIWPFAVPVGHSVRCACTPTPDFRFRDIVAKEDATYPSSHGPSNSSSDFTDAPPGILNERLHQCGIPSLLV